MEGGGPGVLAVRNRQRALRQALRAGSGLDNDRRQDKVRYLA